MQDQDKTKEQLIDELNKMRRKVAEFEAAEGKSLGPGKILRQSEGLREIEKNLSGKRPNILSPDNEIEQDEFAKVVDIPRIQSLMDDFYKLTNIGIAILDLKGNILVANGWHDICTKFHRVHPETLKNCLESDVYLTENVREGEYLLYKCKNNMWEVVTPIFMGGKHVGNVFYGQFLFEDEAPDSDLFAAQAERCGFDKSEYLAALQRVLRWSNEKIADLMRFYSKLASMIGQLSHSNLKLRKTLIESKMVANALRESEEKYRNLVESISDVIFEIDGRGALTYISPAVRNAFGYEAEDFIGKTFLEFVHPEDSGFLIKRFAELAKGVEYPLEYRVVGKSGEVHHVRTHTKPIMKDNTFEGARGTLIDITERKRIDEALRQSEDKFSKAFFLSPDAIAITRLADGVYVSVNESFREILGYAEEEVIGKTSLEINIWENPEDGKKLIEGLKADGAVTNFEARFLAKDGDIRCGLISAAIVVLDGVEHILNIARDITERKRFEDDLQKSEEKFAKVFHFAPALITLSNVDDGAYLDVNDKFCEVSGFSRAESLGKTSVDLGWIAPEDRIRLIEELQGHGSVRGMDLKLLAKDKRQIHCIYNGELIQTKDRQLLLSIALDITERKKIEETLRERERVWATLINNLPGFVYRCANDRDWTMEYISHGCLEVTGYAPDDFIGNNNLAYNDIVHPDYREPLWEKWQKLIINKGVFEEEYPIIAKGGEARWVWERGRGIFSKAGQLLFLEGFILDITERKRSEETVQRSEKFLEQVLENIPNMIFVKEAENLRFIRFNRAGEELLGYSREALLGKNDYDFFPPAQADFFTAKDKAVLTDGKLLDIPEEEIETKLKGKRILHTKKIPILNADGTAQFLLGISEDITERKQFEESQRLLSTAIEQAAEAVIITDARGVIQYVNTAQEILSGYSRDELIGQTPNVLNSDFHPGDFYEQIWDTIGVGKAWSGRFINRKKDGNEYHQDATISPIYDKSGNLSNFVVLQNDVTQKVELQEQLFQAQKMEAIGTLAGGFAHDFRNMLQVVMGSLELIEFNKDLPDHLRTDLDRIRKAAASGAELVKGMLVFSRKTSVKLEPLNLNKLVEQVESLLARTIPKMIKIDVVKAHDLSSIKGDSTQIEQILMNLAINASDAMPDGGTLTMQTMNTVLDEKFCSSHPNTRPGPYVLLSVTDNGSGMEEQTVKRIFEPFFTTKVKGKGTGLGLAVVYGIAEQHGARIICESKPSVGTTFKIYFPAVEEIQEEKYLENKEPPRGQGETILMVDDEPEILEMATRLLNDANYQVIAAATATQAIELYEKHRDKIRLVLLDLIMPEIGGKLCLEALRNMDPNVKVFIITGYTQRGMTQELKDAGARDFILKPFDTPQLLEKIRKIIDESLP